MPKKSKKNQLFLDEALLKDLINVDGVSGHEGKVRELIKKSVRGCFDKVWTDKLGNLIAHKKGKGPSIMLAAHMDEVGLMVKGINEFGFIKFSPIGSFEANALVGERVMVKGTFPGIVTTKNMIDGYEEDKNPELDDLFIDVGLSKSELKKLKVEPGTYITLENKYLCCSKLTDIFTGKALDDRIGCYILVDLARRIKKLKQDIYFVFTVQEEIGLYGAKVSTYKVEPDLAIVLDVTNSDQKNKTKLLGKGPVLVLKDAEMLTDKKLNNMLKKVARKNKIKLQYEVGDFGTTDALRISFSKGGIPTTVIGVVVRNIHSAVSTANKEDISDTILLLECFLKELNSKKR